MAHPNAVQMVNYWYAGGGTATGTAYIVALIIAHAESGWDTTAISPSSDYGLWQINKVHFGNGIIDAHNWSDPVVNARAAVAISGNGTNWAAWCTAWANPKGNCGHGYLPTFQQGSAASQHEATVMALLGAAAPQLGLPPGITPHAQPVAHAGNQKVSQAWDDMNHYIHTTGPAQWAQLNRIQHAIDKVAN